MPITITYTNGHFKEYNLFKEIEKDDYNLIFEINCSNTQLTSLPDNMNFPNLQRFDCSTKQLTSLPDNMNFPKLQTFDCSNNKLTSLCTDNEWIVISIIWISYTHRIKRD